MQKTILEALKRGVVLILHFGRHANKGDLSSCPTGYATAQILYIANGAEPQATGCHEV